MTYNGSDKHKQALFEKKQDKLTAGDNISLTPLQDGTVRIDAEGGGGTGTVTDVLVDGVSVVNQDGEAEIPAIPSELDDLDDVSISSPVIGEVLAYNPITQKWENGSGYDRYAPIIYSLQEREVGVWTDGKPLYQKTIMLSNTIKNNLVQIDVSDLAIDTCAQIFGFFSRVFTGSTPNIRFMYPFNMTENPYSSGGSSIYGWVRYSVSDKEIQYNVYMYGTVDVTDKQIITIQYTKNTDVPGSGTWGTDGVPMVHYDGNERIIGTWFGEILYEKTYHYTGTLNAHSFVTLDSARTPAATPFFSVSDVCLLSTSLSSSAKISAFNTSIPFDIAISTGEQLYFENKSNYTIYEFYVTVKYTKAQ